MADIKKRYDEQPVLSPAIMASDIACIQRSPFGPGSPFQKYTQAQLAEFMQNYLTLTTESNIANVSKAGNDSTADGSLQFPFLTIRAAQLSISDASASKIYNIVVQPGIYTETSLKFIPFQYISALAKGTVTIDLTNDMSWGPTWLLQSPVGGLVNLNFTGVGRVRPINNPALYANGTLNILNCDIPYFNLNYGRDIVTTINNCKIDYYETNRSEVDIINCRIVDSFIQSGITRINNCTFTGTGVVNSNLGSDDVYIYNSQIDGAFTISGSGTNLYCDAPSYPIGLIVASSATVNRLTTSESVLTDYTAVNFTATDPSVKGAIEGIDNKLAEISRPFFPFALDTLLNSSGTPPSSLSYLGLLAHLAFDDGEQVNFSIIIPDNFAGGDIDVVLCHYMSTTDTVVWNLSYVINKTDGSAAIDPSADGTIVSSTAISSSSHPYTVSITLSGIGAVAGDLLSLSLTRDFVNASQLRLISLGILMP